MATLYFLNFEIDLQMIFKSNISKCLIQIQRDADDIDLQKRQEAFHRLQWLKIEENRLAEENRRLESRLDDLKNQHKRETTQSTMKTAIMEQKLHELEDEEIEKQEQYEYFFNTLIVSLHE